MFKSIKEAHIITIYLLQSIPSRYIQKDLF